MRRRDFLLSSSLLPFLGLPSAPAYARPHQQKILILLELAGGNDGLNTLIPYLNSSYYRARPKLSIPREQVLPLGENMGMHPSLKPLLSSWKRGAVSMDAGCWLP